MSARWVRPHHTMTFDALIDHVLTDHEDWLRERFKTLIRSIEDLGETYAQEVGYPLSDEPDVSLVDCTICWDGAAQEE